MSRSLKKTKLLVWMISIFAIIFIYFVSNIIGAEEVHFIEISDPVLLLSLKHSVNTMNNITNVINKPINNRPSNVSIEDNYKILFVCMDTSGLISKSQNKSLSSWATMTASLQYHYTTIYHGYDYLYYTLNKKYSTRTRITECVHWKYKNGKYKFGLQANYCKILILYHALVTYSHKYEFIVYMDSDAYVRTTERTFKQWISKHFLTDTHPKSIFDYAMIFVSQKPYTKMICTGFIIIPTIQTMIAKEMIEYWYERIGYEKADYKEANYIDKRKDQAVFNNQVYTVAEYKKVVYEIDETQIFNCKNKTKYYRENPYFIHFHSYLRRDYVAKKCGTHQLYYDALKRANIYDNITNYVEQIKECCVYVPDFRKLQDLIYS
eukprot:282800_1